MADPVSAAKNVADFLRGTAERIEEAMARAAADYAGNLVTYGGTVAQSADAIVDDRFKGSGNRRFTALSPKYAKWKRDRFGAKAILVRTGALRKAITAGAILRPLGNGAVMIVFRVPEYGLYHEVGGPHLPVRSPVQPNEADKRKVQASFAKHLAFVTKRDAAKAGITVQ